MFSRREGGHGSSYFPAYHSLLQPQTRKRTRTVLRNESPCFTKHITKWLKDKDRHGTSFPTWRPTDKIGPCELVRGTTFTSPCLGYQPTALKSGSQASLPLPVLRHIHPPLGPGSGVGEGSGIPRFPSHTTISLAPNPKIIFNKKIWFFFQVISSSNSTLKNFHIMILCNYQFGKAHIWQWPRHKEYSQNGLKKKKAIPSRNEP